jgi:hypothetical protein
MEKRSPLAKQMAIGDNVRLLIFTHHAWVGLDICESDLRRFSLDIIVEIFQFSGPFRVVLQRNLRIFCYDLLKLIILIALHVAPEQMVELGSSLVR